jgi:hypothetical protein
LLEIFAIQQEHFNANCASWYLIPGKSYNDRVTTLLNRYMQETGIHAVENSGFHPDRGVTFHSGPGAVYWNGIKTVKALEKSPSNYGEMLSIQLCMPKPGWIENGKAGRRSSVWLLPIHFPLEGTTKDINLEYFDLLLNEFREMIQIGGHVIIGSHPDLNQSLLKELIKRESFEEIWFAPIKEVLDRCRKLYEYGSISTIRSSDGHLSLVSRQTIADVHIQVFEPGEKIPNDHCLQLNAKIPREIK